MQPPTQPSMYWRPGLRLQLIFAFGLLCIVLAIALAVAIGSLVYLRTETLSVVTIASAKSQIASDVAIATLLCRRYEKDIFLNIDAPEARAMYLAHWQASYTDLQRLIEQYAGLASTDQDRQQVVVWRRESSAYQNAILDIERAIAAGRLTTPQAANAALTPFKDSIRTLTDLAQAAAQGENAALKQTNIMLIATSDRSLYLLVGVGLVALVLALSWSILFPTRLLQPIQHLRTVTQRFAQGELTARADLVRADELGALAGSFNQMAARIRQQMIDLDQSAVVREQNEQLRTLLDLVHDLEIPAIPLLDQVLLVPLVGHLDTRRARLLQQRILEAVHIQYAHTAILDLTGLAMVDTAVAHHIQQLATAIQLLGTQVIVTGIRAPVAQTLSRLGTHFETVQIAGRLQEGIAAVIHK
jgi:anti-anti-sigma regulatory factor/HAMP domain-containing protein